MGLSLIERYMPDHFIMTGVKTFPGDVHTIGVWDPPFNNHFGPPGRVGSTSGKRATRRRVISKGVGAL